MRPRITALRVATVLLMLAVGYVNTHTDEETVVAGFLLLSSFALGFAQPGRPWRWALLLGLSVPLSALLALVLGLRLPYPNDLDNVATSLVALIPAFVAAYLGAGFRQTVRQPRGRP